MQKNSNKTKKSDRLPKCWSYQRELFNKSLLKSEGYEESVKKGLPFFTLKELSDLERKYQRGITWNEIDTELSKKGMIFKKTTFRKYIQERKLPPSTAYKATKKGREAIYPTNIIKHINFIQYFYRIADNEIIDKILEVFSYTAEDAIAEQLDSQNLREGVFMCLRNMSADGDDIEQAIYDVLQHDPEFMKKVESGLDEIYNVFHEKFNEWVKILRGYEISISDKE